MSQRSPKYSVSSLSETEISRIRKNTDSSRFKDSEMVDESGKQTKQISWYFKDYVLAI